MENSDILPEIKLLNFENQQVPPHFENNNDGIWAQYSTFYSKVHSSPLQQLSPKKFFLKKSKITKKKKFKTRRSKAQKQNSKSKKLKSGKLNLRSILVSSSRDRDDINSKRQLKKSNKRKRKGDDSKGVLKFRAGSSERNILVQNRHSFPTKKVPKKIKYKIIESDMTSKNPKSNSKLIAQQRKSKAQGNTKNVHKFK